MNTQSNINKLRSEQNQLFDNNYIFLIEQLTDYYISKSDGQKRILLELKKWDEISQTIILRDLADNLQKYDMDLKFEINI